MEQIRGRVTVTETNCLATVASAELLKQLVSGVEPGSTHYASTKVATWKCPDCSYIWQTAVFYRTRRNHGCPACVNHAVSDKNNLAVTHPELAKQFSAKNLPLTTKEIIAGTAKKLWWTCSDCGYEWQAAGYMRKAGTGCPACHGRVASKDCNLALDNPELASEYSSRNKLTASDYRSKSNKKVWWICSICKFEWQAVIASRTAGRGCPECWRTGRRPHIRKKRNSGQPCFAQQFPLLASQYSDRNHVPAKKLIVPNGTDPLLWWKCSKPECGCEWQARLSARIIPEEDLGCPECYHKNHKRGNHHHEENEEV